MVKVHVRPEAVLVAVCPLTDGADHLCVARRSLAMVTANVHAERVGVLELLVAVWADAAARGAVRRGGLGGGEVVRGRAAATAPGRGEGRGPVVGGGGRGLVGS